jgi:hypothetical protein
LKLTADQRQKLLARWMQYVKKVNSLRHGTKRPDMNQWDEASEWEFSKFTNFMRNLIPPATRKGMYLGVTAREQKDNVGMVIGVDISGTDILRLHIEDPLRIEELAEWDSE